MSEDHTQLDVEPLATVEGVVERIVYENPDNGFVVARLREGNAADLTTFVGELLAVSPGETVRLRGRWIDDRKFGRQLRVVAYQTILPRTTEGIVLYLSSGLLEGIGPVYAKRLVDTFGLDTLRVIEEHPGKLQRVPGIGKRRAAQIRASWEKHRSVQSIMLFLQESGISANLATRIYKQYGDKAAAVIRANPYQLANDITGISFTGADSIARKLGIAADSAERVEAGLLHVLRGAENEGHLFLREPDLLQRASELLTLPEPALQRFLVDFVARQGLVREADALFRPQMHAAERGVADLLRRLVRTPHDPVPIQVENALRWVERHLNIELSPQQQEALRTGATAKVLVITGGPGTGKTTVIRSLLSILEKKSLSFLLCAPTGRAARRMQEATDHEAKTLHRLLEFSPITGRFTRDENNPLITDLVVVDEASMIDAQLMHALLKAIPPFARLVLVGDIDQLPSVGAGNVLTDVIASGIVPVVRLEVVFRQAEESGIIAAAHRINRGELPHFNEIDFFLLERGAPEKVNETIVELVARRMPARFGLDPVRDIQILSPLRRGEAGVTHLNELMQETLNPSGVPVPRRNLRQGDKVMQLRNNYELEVYNGDVGILSLVDEAASEAEVTFDDRKVIYPFEELDNLGLAYAVTIHKSQGSEYPAVIIPFLPQHYMMLQRNVLYTGVTRGKRLVIIVGMKKAVAMAVRNSRIAARNTRLVDRLRGSALPAPP